MIYIFASENFEPAVCIGFENNLRDALKVGAAEVKKHRYSSWYLADEYMDEIPEGRIPLCLWREVCPRKVF